MLGLPIRTERVGFDRVENTYRVGGWLVHPQHALPSTVRLINPNPLV